MIILSELCDTIQALISYQLFITPLPGSIGKEYQSFAERACRFIAKNRTTVIRGTHPRPYIIHQFAQLNNPHAKKILITHGWMSRAAYMVRFIRALHYQGYDVFALDFPAHGEAKGWQLPWIDAVTIIRDTINHYGPFEGLIGHSFGGSMLLVTLILSNELLEWRLKQTPNSAVLLASPTSFRMPVFSLARRLGLNSSALKQLKKVISEKAKTELKTINFRRLIDACHIPILCIHGKEDLTVNPQESIRFCQEYPHASLTLFPEMDHVEVLIDERVEKRVCHFLGTLSPVSHDTV